MMSDFMFPIYLATNKNSKKTHTERRDQTGQREIRGKTEGREARGRPRKTRERQS